MDEASLRQLLRRLDDRTQAYAPPRFDHSAATARARSFVRVLDQTRGEAHPLFGGEDGSFQDAPFFAMVAIEPAYLRFSCFGDLIGFLPEPDLRPSEATCAIVAEVAAQTGCTLVPRSLLVAPYDGELERRRPARWWDRYFDWF